MSSKYVDVTAITQVIGCIFNKPDILNDAERYPISEEDFPDEFHRVVFGTMYQLHEMETNVTLDSVIDFLAVRPKYDAIFKAGKGIEYLTKASQLATFDTFNYYYSRMKKFSLLRAYDNIGLDVRFLYDPDNIMDTKKKQMQEDWLDNSSLADIANTIDKKIDEVKLNYGGNEISNGFQAGDGLFELIDELKLHPEVGAPMYGRLINTVTRGQRLRKFYLRSAGTGTGKALPNDTIIPTPDGDRRVGDIRPGDYLFGQDGKPTKVLAIYPQPEPKEVWRLTFEDGRQALCCEEHLWQYKEKFGEWEVGSLKEMRSNFEPNKYSIPLTKPVMDQYYDNRRQFLKEVLEESNVLPNEPGIVCYEAITKSMAEHIVELSWAFGYKASNERKTVKINIIDRTLKIVSIEDMGYKTDMTCFTVDNPSHLFLVNGWLVTHNTRALVADAANTACDYIYDTDFGMWIKNGVKLPTLFIATEQDKGEIQTMLLAFLSGVNEEHILNGRYDDGEEDRVRKAATILADSPLWVECIPDFSIQDIENIIKTYIIEHDVTYFYYDYLHTSMKILEEVSRRSGGVKLREDNVLFMLSTRLKDIANKYGVFIMSATQLSGDIKGAVEPDQSLLRGAKSIADEINS